METVKKYCGIDVSMDTLDVCYQDDTGEIMHLEVENNKNGFKKIIKNC